MVQCNAMREKEAQLGTATESKKGKQREVTFVDFLMDLGDPIHSSSSTTPCSIFQNTSTCTFYHPHCRWGKYLEQNKHTKTFNAESMHMIDMLLWIFTTGIK